MRGKRYLDIVPDFCPDVRFHKLRDFPESVWKTEASFNCPMAEDERTNAGQEAAPAN